MAKTGRKSKLELDPQVTEKIVLLLKGGNTREVAARAAGISKARFYDWMKRGSQQEKGEFRDFRDAVMRAEAEMAVVMVGSIRKAAVGYPTKTTRTKSWVEVVRRDDGEPLTDAQGKVQTVHLSETVTTESNEFDWKAAESWLKRRHRADWGDSLDVKKLDDETVLRLLAGVDSEDDE